MESTATRGRRNTGTRSTPDGGQDARLPGGQAPPAEEDQVAAADVGPGEGDLAAGDGGALHPDAVAVGHGVLDHHHGVGAAGHDPAGGDGGRPAGGHLEALGGRLPGRQGHGGHPQPHRVQLLGAEGVGGPHGEAVHVGPVEGGDVHRGEDVGGQHPSPGPVQGDLLHLRRQVGTGGGEAAMGLGLVHHVEELALLHAGPSRGR